MPANKKNMAEKLQLQATMLRELRNSGISANSTIYWPYALWLTVQALETFKSRLKVWLRHRVYA